MKARLKLIILSALGTVAAFSAITYSSCTPDKCKAIVCAYGGVCTDGACSCQTGYEGVQCESVSRDKFIGRWNVTETSTLNPGTHNYSVSLEAASAGITDIKISNFYNQLTSSVTGSVKGDTIYIPFQVVESDTIQGNGYIIPDPHYTNHAKMVIYYSVRNGHTDNFGLNGGSPSVWEK